MTKITLGVVAVTLFLGFATFGAADSRNAVAEDEIAGLVGGDCNYLVVNRNCREFKKTNADGELVRCPAGGPYSNHERSADGNHKPPSGSYVTCNGCGKFYTLATWCIDDEPPVIVED